MLAVTADGIPVAYENEYHKGRAIIFGSFAGQENYEHPVAMHPLARWAGLSDPKLRAPGMLELRQMHSSNGPWVFFFNHAEKSASVEFARTLENPASRIREIMTGEEVRPAGTDMNLKVNVPPQSVRIFRIDF